MKKMKLQITKNEIPNYKFQITNKFQIPIKNDQNKKIGHRGWVVQPSLAQPGICRRTAGWHCLPLKMTGDFFELSGIGVYVL
jgi:hypothetical protein